MESSKFKHVNLNKIFSESVRVLRSEKRILIQLAIVFILPFSLATALYSALNPQIPKEATNPNLGISLSKIDIFFSLGNYLVSLIFFLFTVGSIAFTAFNGFYQSPTKLKSAIKSIPASFFRLLATTLLFHAIIFVASFLLSFVVLIFFAGLTVLGFTQIMASKNFVVILTASVTTIMTYFEVNWILASTVVVVESKWGFEALKRSKNLIKGKRWLALSLVMFLEIYNVIFSLNSSGITVIGLIRMSLLKETTATSNNVNSNSLFITVVLILVNTCIGAIGQLCNLVAATVLYAYCNESQRGDEYFSLSVNEEKVASVI